MSKTLETLQLEYSSYDSPEPESEDAVIGFLFDSVGSSEKDLKRIRAEEESNTKCITLVNRLGRFAKSFGFLSSEQYSEDNGLIQIERSGLNTCNGCLLGILREVNSTNYAEAYRLASFIDKKFGIGTYSIEVERKRRRDGKHAKDVVVCGGDDFLVFYNTQLKNVVERSTTVQKEK